MRIALQTELNKKPKEKEMTQPDLNLQQSHIKETFKCTR